LKIGEEAATTLFDDLRAAGLIARGDELLSDSEIPDRNGQHWTISTGDVPGIAQRFAAAIEKPCPIDREPMAADLLRRAIAHRASDVHLDPFGEEVQVRFRIDGRMEHYCRLGEKIGAKLCSQLKVLADLDPSEPFHPHEGRLHVPVTFSDWDVRITTTPVVSGEAIALRLLHRDQIIRPIESLAFAVDGSAPLRDLLSSGEGIVLLAGPAGVGKTTTAYSLVHALDDGHLNIVTIEDPVEYLVPEFVQLQVDPKHQVSLAAGLRTALRMDPDVILLGEIRDSETAAVVMRAASTGKHIFTTFHARDAVSAITGLRAIGIDDRLIGANVRAFISQRLMRRVCDKCRGVRQIEENDRQLFTEMALPVPADIPTAVGCVACRQTGYHERSAVFEIFPVDAEVETAILEGKSESDLRSLACAKCSRSTYVQALTQVCEGVTTLEEALSAMPSPPRAERTNGS
jgi:type II secretory ATPase GspE/PulE/Tfp pilus assembly ATPase PilB-like protein